MDLIKQKARRIGIAIAGGVVLMLGILAIPYPGPGWLIVFAGLAILATEFIWARNALAKVRGVYDAWSAWLKKQHVAIRLSVLALTGLIVLATVYLLNVLGMADDLLSLDAPWLHSPLWLFK